jgi:peptidyl-prolyl cis-trans isomerase C
MSRLNDLLGLAGVLAVLVQPAISLAQAPAPSAAAPAPLRVPPGPGAPASPGAQPSPGQDPVIGSVDGKLIYLSDLTRVTASLPEQMRSLPFDSIMPVLLDRMIDHEALTMTARRAGLDRRPEIQREMRAAADLVLERAWLAVVTPSKVTDAAIEARYNRQYANRPATDEVHARHILVGTEAEAKSVLEELKGGADFPAMARVISKDPDGKQGGDLGFFRRDQVWPAFADAAFSLRPGQVGPQPIHNEFGWHVVKVEERRLVAPPTLSEVRDQIRQDLTAQAVQGAIAEARSQMIIHKFNLDGSEADAGPRITRAGSEGAR